MIELKSIDKSWTLFLDRDGVINIEKYQDYIHNWDEFHFYNGAVDAIAGLSKIFGRIIVVTNQKGVGKGVTRLEDVHIIHDKMKEAIEAADGRIDAIFFCTDSDDESPNRKPNPGMAFQAKELFNDIDLSKSMVVGNNLSDMQFGRNAGMKTVFVRTTHPTLILPEGMADVDTADLPSFLELLEKK